MLTYVCYLLPTYLLLTHPACPCLPPVRVPCYFLQVGDPETAKQMKEAAEAEVAELAKAAARADSMARAAQKAELGAAQTLELQRLKVGWVLLVGWFVR